METNNKLHFAFEEYEGKLAIWASIDDGQKLLVHPYKFYSKQNAPENYNSFMYKDIEHLKNGSFMHIAIAFHTDYFSWTVSSLPFEQKNEYHFECKDYLSKIIDALRLLIQAYEEQIETYYGDLLDTTTLTQLLHQTEIMSIFYMPHRPRVNDLTIEPVSCIFHYTDSDGDIWSLDIPYTISIGDRKIKSYLSDWSTDLDTIRHDLENYTYHHEAKVSFHFEDSPCEILLSRLAALDKAIDTGTSISYKYKHYMQVEIRPNEFTKTPSLLGICEEQEVIQQIYEALLFVGLHNYHYEDGSHDNDWRCSPNTFYNSIKSPIIEDYLRDDAYDESKLTCRQITIKKAFVISPDVDLQFQSIDAGLTFEKKDELVFYEDEVHEVEICRMIIPGFEKWWKEFVSNADFADSCMKDGFERDAWHKRGMELAQQIRDLLPDEYDLWYGYPFEDEKNRYKRPRLIYKTIRE